MFNKKIILKGTLVTLKSMCEDDFDAIVGWRNNPENMRYMNQPFTLTLELQQRWYEKTYLPSNDILFIFIENSTGKKFGTVGAYDFRQEKSTIVTGRLIIGEREFRRSPELLEGMILFYDYLFYTMHNQTLYCHVAEENKPAMSLNRRFGFVENAGKPIYPRWREANNIKLTELVCDLDSYEIKKAELLPMLQHFVSQKVNETKNVRKP